MNSPDCIEWTGSYSTTRPYGVAYFQGRNTSAHRVAYCKHHGVSLAEIKGQDVCHSCDNPRCVNVTHLFLGTHQQNMQDASRKGRTSSGARHREVMAQRKDPYGEKHSQRTKEKVPRGVEHYKAKLTMDQVEQIRKRYAVGDIAQWRLGLLFGVSQMTISFIVRGRSYQ